MSLIKHSCIKVVRPLEQLALVLTVYFYGWGVEQKYGLYGVPRKVLLATGGRVENANFRAYVLYIWTILKTQNFIIVCHAADSLR